MATDVCEMQIKCNKERFSDGNDKGRKQTCTEDIMKKNMTETRIVKVEDFPEGVRSMKCHCKVLGTEVIKSDKIILKKACEYLNV